MGQNVLIVSTMASAQHCAHTIEQRVSVTVEVVASKRTALAALRRTEFAVVVVEESLAESDPEWADHAWELAGMAIPLQVNFAIAGCARLGREVKAALLRRDGEYAVAKKAATAELANDLKSSVTSLLLESELALREPSIPASLEPKLRHLVALAGALRERLEGGSRL